MSDERPEGLSDADRIEAQIREWAPAFIDGIALNDIDGAKARLIEAIRNQIAIVLRMDREAREQSTALARLREERDRLRTALKLVEKWREGPEGPEILFHEGAMMIKAVRAALSSPSASEHTKMST